MQLRSLEMRLLTMQLSSWSAASIVNGGELNYVDTKDMMWNGTIKFASL
jgi:hypothetical protein